MVEAVMEIGALIGTEWSGIPALVADLAREALADEAIAWRFMIDTIELPRLLVEHILAARSGTAAAAALPGLLEEHGTIDPAGAVGLFTNIKTARELFRAGAMIVYDLSPLLTPDFHRPADIPYFADHIRGDIATSERIFCISRATRDDVAAYLAAPADRLALIEPGVTIEPVALSAAQLASQGLAAEPYVVIVGTLEPRKNGRIMLDHLAAHPGFAARYRTVFVGRDGWLDEKTRLMAAATTAGVGADRILFTGYLTEAEKWALMLNAAFCIYPSFFEGYGLPVLEAAALGRLTVCSNSSSLPEVAPESCIFFDPLDAASFAVALAAAEAHAAAAPPPLALPDLLARAAACTPARTYRPIAEWVLGR